jgi:hypothetical protein
VRGETTYFEEKNNFTISLAQNWKRIFLVGRFFFSRGGGLDFYVELDFGARGSIPLSPTHFDLAVVVDGINAAAPSLAICPRTALFQKKKKAISKKRNNQGTGLALRTYSMITMAAMVSTIETARGTTHGS